MSIILSIKSRSFTLFIRADTTFSGGYPCASTGQCDLFVWSNLFNDILIRQLSKTGFKQAQFFCGTTDFLIPLFPFLGCLHIHDDFRSCSTKNRRLAETETTTLQ